MLSQILFFFQLSSISICITLHFKHLIAAKFSSFYKLFITMLCLAYVRQACHKPAARCFVSENLRLYCILPLILNWINYIWLLSGIKINPFKWPYLRRFKNAIFFLRKIAKDQINERIKKIKNEEYVPNDILSKMLEHRNGYAFYNQTIKLFL